MFIRRRPQSLSDKIFKRNYVRTRTGEIFVDLKTDSNWIVDLSDDQIGIPGITVEAFDNGMFRLRIGPAAVEIAEAFYVVDGKQYQWLE